MYRICSTVQSAGNYMMNTNVSRVVVVRCSLCADSCETGKKILKSTHTYNFSNVYVEARTRGFLLFHFADFLRDITSISYLARPETAPLAYSSGSKRQQDPTRNRGNVKVEK
jgi:hypothetical protein